MKKYRRFILIAVVVILVGVVWAYREYTRKNIDLTDVHEDYMIAAPTLIKEFETNDSSANKKFLGKTLLVTGALKDFSKDGNYITLILGDTSSMSAVRCAMDTSHAVNQNDFARGVPVNIKGSCTGFNKDELLGSDVIMNRCVVVKP